VRTTGGEKLMSELEVGDMVLVPVSGSTFKLERVEMFYHREPETVARFVHIRTEQGRTLSLTALHLLPSGSCEEMMVAKLDNEGLDQWMRKSRFAHRVQPGECLMIFDAETSQVSVDRVAKVGRKLSKGIYSPITVEGTIVTNDIIASCFSQIESHSTQKLAYDVLYAIYRTFGYMKDLAGQRVQEVPSLLNYVHQFSWYMLPFSKY